MKKNICFFVTNLDPTIGGTERVTFSLFQNIGDHGFRPFMIYTNKGSELIGDKYKLKVNSTESIEQSCELISKFVQDNNIKVLIIVNRIFHSEKYIKLLRKVKMVTNVKLVFSLHAAPDNWVNKNKRSMVLAKTYYKELIKSLIYKFWNPHYISVRNAYTLSDKFLLLSKSYIEPFIDTYNIERKENKLVAIPNPCPFDEKYEDSKKENIVLIVSRMQEDQKRIFAALKIWHNMNHKDGWKLIIVGDGPDMNKYKNIAKNIGGVDFVGHSNNVQSYYKRSKIFMMTSIWEGLPMTLIEAMHYGCIPVVFDSFAAVYDLIRNGETGYIIPNNNICQYVNTMDSLLNDKSLVTKLSNNIINNPNDFNFETILKLWQENINKLIEQ